MKLFSYIKIGGVLIVIALMYISCEIINPKEEIPSYIKIDTIKVFTNYATQGSKSNTINDVWVYIDDNQIGTYELPTTFPVLAKGKHKITIYPGIKKNGISASRIIQPFFNNYTIDTLLTQAEILTIKPYFTYKSETKFVWNEDFENAGLSIKKTALSDTNLIKISNHVYEGNYSGAIYLTATDSKFDLVTVDSFYLPKDNSPVFLEMDYKNNNEFIVGIYAYQSSQCIKTSVITINPRANAWNKVYIDLTQMLMYYADAYYYKIYFGGYKSSSVLQTEIYLDNIKLVHF